MSVLLIPFEVAAVLAEAVAVACAHLKDSDGRACPVRRLDRTDFLAQAVKAIDEIAALAGDTVALMPPPPVERPPLHLDDLPTGDLETDVDMKWSKDVAAAYPGATAGISDGAPSQAEQRQQRRLEMLANRFVPQAAIIDRTVKLSELPDWKWDVGRDGWVFP